MWWPQAGRRGPWVEGATLGDELGCQVTALRKATSSVGKSFTELLIYCYQRFLFYAEMLSWQLPSPKPATMTLCHLVLTRWLFQHQAYVTKDWNGPDTRASQGRQIASRGQHCLHGHHRLHEILSPRHNVLQTQSGFCETCTWKITVSIRTFFQQGKPAKVSVGHG